MTTLLTRITRSLTTIAAVFGLACALPAQATETIIYLHNDISGSPQAATDASGNVLWKESYTPYGERTVNSPSSATGKGTNQLYFHGKKVEDLNGGVHLSYFGARYYDPSLGRFLQIDPVPVNPNDIHSFNRYAFANNNPYRYVDPDGRAAADLFPSNAPIVSLGRGLAALTVYTEGVVTGNAAMRSVGAEGLSESRAGAVEAMMLLASLRSGGAKPANSVADLVIGSRRPSAETRRQADAAATDSQGNIRCQYCGQTLTTESGKSNSREYDHKIPYSRGGSSDIGNITDSCRTCNRSKSNKTVEEWRSSSRGTSE